MPLIFLIRRYSKVCNHLKVIVLLPSAAIRLQLPMNQQLSLHAGMIIEAAGLRCMASGCQNRLATRPDQATMQKNGE